MRPTLLWLSTVSLLGCVGPGGAPAGAPTVETRADVALLVGPVSVVDGIPVRGGSAPIPLVSGCHNLRTSQDFLTTTQTGEVVQGRIAPAYFALKMQAGLNYWVERKIMDTTGASSDVRFTLYERDAAGKVLDTYSPRSADSAMEFCASSN